MKTSFEFEDCKVSVRALNKAWEILENQHAVEISGNFFTKATYKDFVGKDHPALSVNDNYIFAFNQKSSKKSWFFAQHTLKFRAAQIPAHIDEEYSLMCDAGQFVINGLGFSNGVGDGDFRLIKRTITAKCNPGWGEYTRAQIYHEATIAYPIDGVCEIRKYDCKPDVYRFENVIEIQIVNHKVYVICENIKK